MPDVVLKNRYGEPITYYGVESVSMNTADGGTATFLNEENVPEGGNGGGFSESDLTNEAVVFEEQNLTFAVSEENFITYPANGGEVPNNGLLGLAVGQEYTVLVDGVENKCVAKEYSHEGISLIYLGNVYLVTQLETDNTGESFMIYEASVMNSWMIGMEVPDVSVLDHTLKITTVGYNELFYWGNIKNPPFEETRKEEQATFLDTSIELTWYPDVSNSNGGRWDNDEVTGNNDLGFTVEPTNDFTLKVGDTYKVTFDGTVYENVVCYGYEGILPVLGNAALSGTEDTTTPYMIVQDTIGAFGTLNAWYVMPVPIVDGVKPDDVTLSSTKTFAFKVEGVAKTVDIKQIEAKYVYGSTFPVFFTPPEDGTVLGTPVENPILSVPFDTICELIDRGHTPELYMKQGPVVMSNGRFVVKYGEMLGFVNSGGSGFENTFTQIIKEDGVVSLLSDELGAETLDVTISNSSGTYSSNYYPRVIKNTYDIGIPIRATCDGLIMNLQAISSTSATFYVRTCVENDIIDSWVTINSDKSVTMKTVTTPIPTASA